MDDTLDQLAGAKRNTSVALGIILLGLAPQIFEFIWSFGTIVGWGSGRGPAQVLIAHVSALTLAAPGAFSAFGADAGTKLSYDVLLALIYSYPLFAVAIATHFVKIRSAQDYVGGIALFALALLALWASSDLQGTRGFSFGAGTAPRMFSVLMLGLGAAVAIMGLLSDGPGHPHYSWRGPLSVMAAIVFFAWAIRPMGLVIAAFVGFLIAALGSHETRWIEAAIVGACLTLACALMFPYVLGLPMPLFPYFLGK